MLRPKRAGAYSKQAGGKQATGERNDGGTLWCAMVRYVALCCAMAETLSGCAAAL